MDPFLHFVDRCQEVSGIVDTGGEWRAAFRRLTDRPFHQFAERERIVAQALLLNIFLKGTIRSKRCDVRMTPPVIRLIGEHALRKAFRLLMSDADRARSAARSAGSSARPDPRVMRGIAYLRRCCADPGLTLGDAARHSRLSKWHFDRLLKSSTGAGFREHLSDVRLAKARSLLRTSTLGVKEIAASVGYKYTSVFSRHFKRRFGVTATTYRQRNLK